MKLLFLSKRGHYTNQAVNWLNKKFDVTFYMMDWRDSFPKLEGEWDVTVSYSSRWIVPDKHLNGICINFHPGTPDYPGIGCLNFALYDDVKEYGVTAHHMTSEVDTGDIIKVRRFPVKPSDNVESLLEKTEYCQYELFIDVMETVEIGLIPESMEKWTRPPYTRDELNQLSLLTKNMSKKEMTRRIRATDHKDFKTSLKINDHIFEYKR